MALQIGQKLYGYCGGYFNKYYRTEFFRVEAIGVDWIVVRDDEGNPDTATGRKALDILESDEYTKQRKSDLCDF